MESVKPVKILYLDIETAQNLVAVFGLAGNDWIDPSNIVRERYIICASWLWEGEDKVQAVSVLDNPKRYVKDPYDDFHVVEKLHQVLSEADVVIGHNSLSFDRKWIDTRILVHGLDPLPPLIDIDTYRVAKQRLYLNSNKLDYIARLLKVGKKKATTPGLWMRVMQGDKAAIRDMVDYNKHDVVILRGVFKKLQGLIPNHFNRQLFGHSGCPRCGSKHVQSRGFHRAISRIYRRWQCQACHGWYRTMKNEPLAVTSRVL